MSFSEKLLQLKDMILGEADEQSKPKHERMSNLRTGGFAGYKPGQQERHRRSGRSAQPKEMNQTASQSQPGAEYYGQEPWGPQTGMQGQPGAYQDLSYVQAQQQDLGYVQQPYYSAPQQTYYSGPQQQAYYAAMQQPVYSSPQPGAYQPAMPEQQMMPPDTAYQEQQMSSRQMPENVIPMPGLQKDENGKLWKHREIVAQPTSAATCYRLIEFMCQGMTVIVNTELISDQKEVQRCLDLLFGAAFTMNCSFHRIAARSIYMITPPDVSVDAYENIRRESNEDLRDRWPNAPVPMFRENRSREAAGGAYRTRESFGSAYAGAR